MAEETGLLATEAIWAHATSRVVILSTNWCIAANRGTIRSVRAELSYELHGRDRITNPDLAGGALLDVGVYALNFIDMAVGADHGRSIADIRYHDGAVQHRRGCHEYHGIDL